MPTKYATFKGSVKWSKVYEPDEFAGASNWKINFYPSDDKEWAKYDACKLMLVPKTDEEGKFITFRRPTKKLIKDDLVIFSPPEIGGKINVKYVDEDGNKVRQYNKGDGVKVTRVGEPELIGNGSTVLVNISYYDTSKGAGHRLENITVLELVEHIPQDQVVEQEEIEQEDKPVSKVVESKSSKVKKEEKPTISEDLNDEIPW